MARSRGCAAATGLLLLLGACATPQAKINGGIASVVAGSAAWAGTSVGAVVWAEEECEFGFCDTSGPTALLTVGTIVGVALIATGVVNIITGSVQKGRAEREEQRQTRYDSSLPPARRAGPSSESIGRECARECTNATSSAEKLACYERCQERKRGGIYRLVPPAATSSVAPGAPRTAPLPVEEAPVPATPLDSREECKQACRETTEGEDTLTCFELCPQ